ncbi:phage holin family protein [Nonlabens mediterrranea]|uniref:Phage holin family protein n=1 Tax=Nonlabens mediterrranea TaxID=1419947 RepID=A0ABS0A686_9FLAO|nr:phage holin family protein [Nonlabens mediterrranea]
MKFIIKLLITAVLVVLLSKLLPGVTTDGYLSAVLVAISLSLLNFIVRPILVILTLPVTIITLGIFLLVINAIIILLADWLVSGFDVDGLLWAFIFSLLLAIGRSILFQLLEKDKD